MADAVAADVDHKPQFAVMRVGAIDGVRSVEVKKLVRLGEEENPDFANGLLILGPLEIARLDNDPDRQENGILTIATGGGR